MSKDLGDDVLLGHTGRFVGEEIARSLDDPDQLSEGWSSAIELDEEFGDVPFEELYVVSDDQHETRLVGGAPGPQPWKELPELAGKRRRAAREDQAHVAMVAPLGQRWLVPCLSEPRSKGGRPW